MNDEDRINEITLEEDTNVDPNGYRVEFLGTLHPGRLHATTLKLTRDTVIKTNGHRLHIIRKDREE